MWRKLVSVTWVVGVNMLVTLDSNFFHENL